MNIRNLGSKESLQRLNLKTACVPNCDESCGWKATGIFVILLSQDGFGSDYPEIKFQTITS